MKKRFLVTQVWLIKLFGLGLVLLFGMVSRFTALNWDAGNHLHPDERFLTMVTEQLSWPKTWKSYFTTHESPLNPHNLGQEFYVYGQWPLFVVKALAQFLHMDTYGGITLVGRGVSAVVELATLVFVILIGAHLAPHKLRYTAGLLSGLSYVCFTLPIQMAHYFVVDPYLVFCLVVVFFALLQKPSFKSYGFVGLGFGLAMSAKISAVYFAPFIVLRVLQLLLQHSISLKKAILLLLTVCCLSISTLRVAYPMLFTAESFFPSGINQQVINNWKSLKAFDGNDTPFPPALQWVPTAPISYVFSQTSFWAIGWPLTVLTLVAFVKIWQHKKQLSLYHPFWLALLWTVFLMSYQSVQFAKTLRYIYPVLPFLAAVIGAALAELHWNKLHGKQVLVAVLFGAGIWWCWSFQSIYRRPHPRVAASEWIYQQIPPGSALSYEYWDDALPLPIADFTEQSFEYRIVELPLYDRDTPEKWQRLSNQLATVDYLMLTSNRLWRSLAALPEKYPITSKYYELLFAEKLGFTKVGQFSSYPCLLPHWQPYFEEQTPPLQPYLLRLTQTSYCALAVADDGAEEAVTVYDHPVVLIFKNTGKLPPEAIRNTLLQAQYY